MNSGSKEGQVVLSPSLGNPSEWTQEEDVKKVQDVYDQWCRYFGEKTKTINAFWNNKKESTLAFNKDKANQDTINKYFNNKRYSPDSSFRDTNDSSHDKQTTDEGTKMNADEIKALLESNYQVILTGAPGTGKTFTAKEVAKALSGDEWVETEGKWKFGQIASVQFHPGYDYSDFVIGMKPVLVSPESGKEVFTKTDGSRYTTNNDKEDGKPEDFPKERQSPQTEVSYKWKDGIFKKFADKARKNYDNPYVDSEGLVKDFVLKFLKEAVSNQIKFETKRRGTPFVIKCFDSDDAKDAKFVKIRNETEKTADRISLKIDNIERMLKEPKVFSGFQEVEGFLKESHAQHHAYYFAVWKAIHDEWVNRKYVFLIDEINRADLSRVFGELFSLLEEEYRYPNGKGTDSILLPNGERFSIPKNLYIIGTMNDIDRSVESMDFALRRRFAWKEIKASDSQSIIDAKAKNEKFTKDDADNLKNAMDAVNKLIAPNEKSDDGTKDLRLGPEYQLGGAIFAKLEKYVDKDDSGKPKRADEKGYKELWDNHIENILREYLRGRSNRDDELTTLKDAYRNALPNDFGDAKYWEPQTEGDGGGNAGN